MPIPVGFDTAPGVTVDGIGTPGASVHDGSVMLGDTNLGYVDAYGVEWGLTKLTGWDSMGTTGGVEQRSGDHGGWVDPAYRPPRILTVEGWLLASSWDGASRSLDRLKTSVPLSDLGSLAVTESEDRILTADVRQAEDLMVERLAGWARFSLSLLAPDPRRYEIATRTASTGLPQTTGGLSLPLVLPLTVGATVTSGVLSATNEGNMDAPVIFTVYGPCPPFAITHLASGRTLRFAESIDAGRFLTIDTDRRRALLDGTARRVVTGTWFDYEPGVNEVAFTAATYDAAALLVSSHRSAWR